VKNESSDAQAANATGLEKDAAAVKNATSRPDVTSARDRQRLLLKGDLKPIVT
jgi:hypothetical protein